MKMATQRERYAEKVAQTFIQKIEDGTAPWRQSWKPGEIPLPKNIVSNNPYRGFNTLWLTTVALNKGYRDPRWMTYKQAQQVGGQVRKGEHGTAIIFFTDTNKAAKRDEAGNIAKDANGHTITEETRTHYPVFKTYRVFNAEQVDGIEPHLVETQWEKFEWEVSQRADGLLENSSARIISVEGGASAFYSPATDSITLPGRDQFPTMIDYYSTAFHELSHWTGHPSRLDRKVEGGFGTVPYAMEELRAEIGQFMMCQQLGLGYEPYNLEQAASYVESWVKRLTDKPQEILKAAADSQKITTYLMQYDPQQQPEHNLKTVVNVPREDARVEKVKDAFFSEMRAKYIGSMSGKEIRQGTGKQYAPNKKHHHKTKHNR